MDLTDTGMSQGGDAIQSVQRSADFATAVAIVRQELSEESAKILRYAIENQEQLGGTVHRTNLGIALRNLLATKGIVWEEVILSSVWLAILQKSLETLLDS